MVLTVKAVSRNTETLFTVSSPKNENVLTLKPSKMYISYSSEQILEHSSLAHQWILRSEWVPSEWAFKNNML